MVERKMSPLQNYMFSLRSNCSTAGPGEPSLEERLASAKRLDGQIATTAEQEINEVIESFAPDSPENS